LTASFVAYFSHLLFVRWYHNFFIQAASSAGFNRPLACNAASRHRVGDDHQGYLLDTNTASYIIKGTISFRSAAVGESTDGAARNRH
jgi:hypothetical protein